LLLRLKPNPKLLDRVRAWSKNPHVRVIGFKLTDTRDLQQRFAAVKKQLEHSGVDAVVHNDLADISHESHLFRVHTAADAPVSCKDASMLAEAINQLMETA
jgi:phosphopantothenoylcysteine synthetase/decarboxylase